jgi:uncharacterized radical SAM superfamily Fe-S cluster-containing enzyme
VLDEQDSAEPLLPDSASCDCNTALSFEEAIAIFKSNMFTISGMAFMDETNLDAERLRRCRVQVFSPDERLVPFCGYYTMYNKANNFDENVEEKK